MESLQILSHHIAVAVVLSLAAGLACAAAPNKVTEEVIVEGTRLEIERRVYTFVTGLTHEGYAVESLARWNRPVCPLVAGIPVAQGEFILRGVSSAALAAGIPLGPEVCRPNFHVVMTSEPDELLNLWRKRAPRLFGGEPPAKVRRLISKPRPVRIWYNAAEECDKGGWTGLASTSRASIGDWMGGGCRLNDSRLAFSAVNNISSVLVIVDLDDVKEIKLGALTDYIAMVGFAQVDLDGNWGDAPTVLRLFASSGDATSQKLSPWDRSFLKALYGTTQTSRFQRTAIAQTMVRGFVGE